MADLKQAAKSKTEPKAQRASQVVELMTPDSEVCALPFSLFAGFPIDTQVDMIQNRSLPAIQRQRLLQRMARVKGNRAVQQMLDCPDRKSIQRYKHFTNYYAVQRAMSEEQETFWADRHGEEIVSAVKSDVGKWQAFRSAPTSWCQRPEVSSAAGSTAPSALSTLYTEAEPEVKRHAVQQLGPGSFRYLTEMAAFIEEYRVLCGVIPGVNYKAPEHKYEMTAKESIMDKIPLIPINTLKVTYSNAFGWSWTKELTGGSIKASVGFGAELKLSGPVKGGGGEKGGGGISLEKGAPGGAPPAGGRRPSIKPKGGFTIWPSRIDIDTKAKAESAGGYWGYEDLPGPLALANGPSATAKLSVVGGKLGGTGGVITLAGSGGSPPGGLGFIMEATMFTAGEFDIDYEPSSSPVEMENGKIKQNLTDISAEVSLIEGGVGGVVGGNVTVSVPELAPRAIPEKKIFKYAISGFETGSADTPITQAECAGAIAQFEKDIANEVANFDAIRQYIEESGVEPRYTIEIKVEGFASRKWQGAVSDAQRQHKNLELSTRRANDVKQILEAVIHTENTTFSAEGKGSAMYLPIDGAANYNEDTGHWEEGVKGGIVVPEGDTAAVDKWREARRRQLRRDFLYNNVPPEQQVQIDKQIDDILKDEEKNLNKSTSDVPGARVVGVMVNWNGYKIEWVAQSHQPGSA